MLFRDQLWLAFSALWQQKIRTLLTTVGVVVGTFALAVSLSLGRGFEAEILRQLDQGDQLRQVIVSPHSEVKEADIPEAELEIRGDISDVKKQRLRKSIVRRYNQRGAIQGKTVYLTEDRIESLRKLPHVREVRPIIQEPFRVSANGRSSRLVTGVSVGADDAQFRKRLIAGDFFVGEDDRCVLVSEFLLYKWNIISDEEVARAIGGTLQIKYRAIGQSPINRLETLGIQLNGVSMDEARLMDKMVRLLPTFQDKLNLTPGEEETVKKMQLRLGVGASAGEPMPSFSPAQLSGLIAGSSSGPFHFLPYLLAQSEYSTVTREFTICGVLREVTEEDEVIGLTTVMLNKNADLFLPVQTLSDMYIPGHRETGYDVAVVHVDNEENVKEVAGNIKKMGLREYSLGEWVMRIRTSTILVTYVTALLAFVALLVASLGITNTMIMSVLERRREIGIMKAVGARDRQVLLIFLIEGALIGGVGGALGILCAWLGSFPGDSLARRLLSEGSDVPLQGALFVFPWWLIFGVPLFSCTITTLAAFYPAARAARLDPIAALRHE